VPLGFICGFPVGNGGEIYGGDMFLRSAAMDTLQGKAIQEANERWGSLNMPLSSHSTGQLVSKRRGAGRKGSNDVYIGMPVCKKKYTPFTVKRKIIEKTPSGKVSVQVSVERMYGCKCHSEIRKQVIEKFGERPGWEPFGQWSIAKAKTEAIKHVREEIKKVAADDPGKKRRRGSCDENACANGVCSKDAEPSRGRYDSLCRNGSCLWKTKDDYDDIDDEIQSSDSESKETVISVPTSVGSSSGPASKRKR